MQCSFLRLTHQMSFDELKSTSNPNNNSHWNTLNKFWGFKFIKLLLVLIESEFQTFKIIKLQLFNLNYQASNWLDYFELQWKYGMFSGFSNSRFWEIWDSKSPCLNVLSSVHILALFHALLLESLSSFFVSIRTFVWELSAATGHAMYIQLLGA